MKLKKDRPSQPLEKPLPRRPVKKAQVLGGVGHLVLSLFQTRFAQGDLLASEPKQTEADQG